MLKLKNYIFMIIFLCLSASLPARADTVPAYDIPKNCQEYAKGMGDMDISFYRDMTGNKEPLTEEQKKSLEERTQKRYAECVQKENADKGKVQALWPKAPAALKDACIAQTNQMAAAEPTYHNSYFHLSECVGKELQYGQLPFPMTDYKAYCKKQGQAAFSACVKEQEDYRDRSAKLWPSIRGSHRRECAKAVEYELSDLNTLPVRWVKTSAGSYKELWKCVDEVVKMYGPSQK